MRNLILVIDFDAETLGNMNGWPGKIHFDDPLRVIQS